MWIHLLLHLKHLWFEKQSVPVIQPLLHPHLSIISIAFLVDELE